MTKTSAGLLFFLACVMPIEGIACAESLGRQDYLTDCARCHGVDGKGDGPQMAAVTGYLTTDLTQLSKGNSGQFPRQEVYDAIDGRKRFPAHFLGDMPAWGLKYQQDRLGPEDEEKVRQRISALVNYIESLQEK